jgi:cytochrome b561
MPSNSTSARSGRRTPSRPLRSNEPFGGSWSAVAKFLHWLVALLILVQFVLGWMATTWRLSPTKLNLFVWHKSTGMVVLALVVVRLLWRLSHPAPALPAGMPPWERVAAHLSHALLYVVMIAMPITGWIVSSAAGVPFSIYWRIPLPVIVPPDKHTEDVAAIVHFSLGIALLALLVLHVGAALRHHFVKRDDVLTRMLPARKSTP